MPAAPRPPSAFRLSLREFFVLFAAVAAGCAALRYANGWWLGAVGLVVMLAFMAQAITALVDRGPRQAFALGFVACLASYLSIFWMETEIHPYQARFPTSRLLRTAFESVRERLYIDESTGDEVTQSNLPPLASIDEDTSWTIVPAPGQGGGMWQQPTPRRYGGTVGVNFRRIGDRPPREQFMPLGHLLWALAFGYIGGHFGRYVYSRRMREQPPAAPITQPPH